MQPPKAAVLAITFLLAPVFTAAALANGESVEEHADDHADRPTIGSSDYEAHNPHLGVEDAVVGQASMLEGEIGNDAAGMSALQPGLNEGAAGDDSKN